MDYDKIIDINYEKNMHKKRKNGIILSDEQIEILSKNNINYLNYTSLESLIYEIENILNIDYNEELDRISAELAEYNYYNNTNK